MTNKLVLKKEEKKKNNQLKMTSYFLDDTTVGKAVNKLKANTKKGINRLRSLSNIVSINAYE